MKIIYDGECPVCLSLKEFAETRDSEGAFDFIPFQAEDFDQHVPGLTKQEASQALIVRTIQGDQARGARAVFEMMKYLPGFWGVAGKIFSLPPLAWIAEPAYRLFARHRHKISQWL